jgi:hypothetical protein
VGGWCLARPVESHDLRLDERAAESRKGQSMTDVDPRRRGQLAMVIATGMALALVGSLMAIPVILRLHRSRLGSGT